MTMLAQPSHMNRAQRNIAWIEEWCRQPDGGMICLSTHARETVAAISTEPQPPRPLPTELAAYLALLIWPVRNTGMARGRAAASMARRCGGPPVPICAQC